MLRIKYETTMLLRSIILVLCAFFFSLPSFGQAPGDGENADTSGFMARRDSIYDRLGTATDSALKLATKNLSVARSSGDLELLARAHGLMALVQRKMGAYQKSIDNCREALRFEKELGDSSGIANSFDDIASVLNRLGRSDSALHYLKKALKVKKAIRDTLGMVNVYNGLGTLHRGRSELVRSLNYYQKALGLLDTSGERGLKDLGLVLGNLAGVQKRRMALDKSLKRYRQAARIFEKKGLSGRGAATEISIGQVLIMRGDSAKGLQRFREAYRYFNQGGSIARKALSALNIGGHYLDRERLDSASVYIEEGLRIGRRIGHAKIVLSAMEKRGLLAIEREKARKAFDIAMEGYKKAQELESLKWTKAFSLVLYKAHQALGQYAQALEFHKEWRRLRDSLREEEQSEELTRMEMRYQFEKEQMQDSLQHAQELQVQKERVEKQRTVRNFLLGGGGLLLLLLALIYERFRVARKRKDRIEEKKDEVDRAYEELHEKNAELEDSINYASRIQSAILTSDSYFKKVLGDHFLFFRPKELVSGDFYWAYGDERHAIWLAADCTGHGVPGAFMSMIGNRLFNEVVVEHGERDPGTIFEKVRSGIIEALEQGNEEETKDGMDAALCVYDRKKGELSFAGAQNPLYVVQSAEEEAFEGSKVLEESGYRLIEIKGDGSPIGRDPHKKVAFRTVSLKLRGGERIYTFSDGFPDQFGGPKGKKYRYTPFKQMLLSIQDRDMGAQREALEKEFEEWKGEQEQIDDVIVIGTQPSPPQ